MAAQAEAAHEGPPPDAMRRSRILHWAAVIGAGLSLWLLIDFLDGPPGPPPSDVVLWELLLSAAFAAEFFTRTGLHWNWKRYLLSHFFDWFAIIPALWFVGQGLSYEGALLWLVLLARVIRVVDRVLGDGFVRRNVLALINAFEEEITDRVLLRILDRVEAALHAGRFGEAVAEALQRNRDPVLARVRAAHPKEGLAAKVAEVSGLEEALAEAEANAYDAVVEVAGSAEVDRALRDVVKDSFDNMRADIGKKEWKKNLGFRPPRV